MSAATPRLDPERSRLGRLSDRIAGSVLPATAFVVLAAVGAAMLVAATLPVGPVWLGEAGALVVATTYSWALAARTGGRPVVFGLLGLAVGGVAIGLDQAFLRTGAAVMVAVVAAVLGVMATVPAVHLLQAVREAVVALVVAAVGAMAAVGFEPTLTVTRFEYTVSGLALVGAFLVVYRLGAGLHGLGRRGVVIVLVGGLLLAITLLYAELLRRYGTPNLVESLLDGVRWSRANLGAFPRPIETVLGVPALVYGCHMRARRRQGWWVCAFGVAATSPTVSALVNPGITLTESVLSVVYGLALGLVIGALVVLVDGRVTGRSTRGGRRSRRIAEESTAIRPEPPRSASLL